MNINRVCHSVLCGQLERHFRGQTIFLDSCSLAAALAELPEQSQEEIFLYYFQHLKQKEIGEQSGWTRSTIGRHIQLALKRLKEEMEVLSHE